MFFIIRLFNTMILLSAIHTHLYVERKGCFGKVFMAYFIIVALHNFYPLFIALFWPDNYVYMDYMAPWGHMHGPLFFFSFQCFLHGKVSRKEIVMHSIPSLLLWIAYFSVLGGSDSFKERFEHPYLLTLYTLIPISWMFYSLYILINTFIAKERRALIIELSMYYILLSAFMILLLTMFHPSVDTPPAEFSNVLVSLFMTLNAMLLFTISQRHLRGATTVVQFTSNLPVEEKKQEHFSTEIVCTNSKPIEEYFSSSAICDANLTLKEAASQLNITQKELTECIRRDYGLTFSKLLTEKRVEYACTILENGEPDMNYEELGSLCGFGSSATFYRNFKEYTGVTPKVFSEENRLEEEIE